MWKSYEKGDEHKEGDNEEEYRNNPWDLFNIHYFPVNMFSILEIDSFLAMTIM